MISNVATQVGWNVVEKKVYSSSARKKIPFKFLQFSNSNDYNFEMNDNDITNQLCLVYRMMSRTRNSK